MNTQPVDLNDVYYLEVEGKGKESAGPIAINIHIEDGKASWNNTRRGHTIRLKEWKELTPESFEFIDQNNTIYRMSLLTREIYNDKFTSKFEVDFQTDQELRQYYQQTFL